MEELHCKVKMFHTKLIILYSIFCNIFIADIVIILLFIFLSCINDFDEAFYLNGILHLQVGLLEEIEQKGSKKMGLRFFLLEVHSHQPPWVHFPLPPPSLQVYYAFISPLA